MKTERYNFSNVQIAPEDMNTDRLSEILGILWPEQARVFILQTLLTHHTIQTGTQTYINEVIEEACCKEHIWEHNRNMANTKQASTLTQNDNGPVGPVTPSICWFC